MSKTDWVAVGGRIRRLRRQRGLSQKEVAGRTITPAYLSLIEAGKRQPSADVLAAIADHLGTTEDQLLTGRNPRAMAKLRLDIEQVRRNIYRFGAAEALAAIDDCVSSARTLDSAELEAVAHEVRGLALQKLRRFPQAIEAFDEAARLLSDAPVEARAPAISGRARCLFFLGDMRYAIHELEMFLIDLNKRPAPDPNALAHTYAALIGPYFEAGLIEKARGAAEQVELLAVRVSDPDVLGCMHMNLGGVYLAEQRIDDALRALSKAEDCFLQIEWRGEVVATKVARAHAFIEKEDWRAARDLLKDSLDGLGDAADPLDRARILNQLGRVERNLGEFTEAERHLGRAGDLADSHALERGLAERELALCAAACGRIDEAKKLLLQSIDSYRTAGNPAQVGVGFKALGDLEAEYGDVTSVADLYREGLEAATAAAL